LKGKPLTTLAHHIDVDWLYEAFRRTRKDGATGVGRRCGGSTSRRGDGSQTRPIGIPTFEDKVLQRAVAMVVEAIYEEELHDFSYGFRPQRSAHQACEAVQNAAVRMGDWFVREVRPRLKGSAVLVRYADDMVFLFAREEDARRVFEVLPKRFGKYGLTLHPEKTRLVPFHRPDRQDGDGDGPGTFDFLGFTNDTTAPDTGETLTVTAVTNPPMANDDSFTVE
jgi:hypothetical protein